MKYGYVRVSTKEQNEGRQIIALEPFEINKKNIFIDKISGKDFNRPIYKKMIRRLKKGDLLIIKSIDRLGRNYDDIIEQWRFLTKDKQIDITVIDMPLLNVGEEKQDLTRTFISDLVLQILSYVAQTERENIRQRQEEGIAAAKLKGVRFGRPRKDIPCEFAMIREEYQKKSITSRQAAKQLNIAQDTFLRWYRGE